MNNVKIWNRGISIEENAMEQIRNVATLPFIHKWVAVMPDAHMGYGATVGSVIPTVKAIIPGAVGVDIGCGIMAVKTSMKASDLPDNLLNIRLSIEAAVPHGRSSAVARHDRGAWGEIPHEIGLIWESYQKGLERIVEKAPVLAKANSVHHLGTLGTGNHFIEICLDEGNGVWVMLHSGSRGIGNAIGRHFIELAKKDMESHSMHLPDENLAYLEEGSENFNDYIEAITWAQRFASTNRSIMMNHTLLALQKTIPKPFSSYLMAVNCHHNYVRQEYHEDEEIWVTRKGAISARTGELGIIPGSMGAKSFIVRGRGNEESFCSASHGAGRVMSRTQAKREVTLTDHEKALEKVECRKDKSTLDETPRAYKDIDAVMEAQKDLVEIVHTLKQVVCVKG